MPGTTTLVTTASVLAKGPLERVRRGVAVADRQAWVAPLGDGWVLVLPERPTRPLDDVDPYDLIGLGRTLQASGCATVLVLSVRGALATAQLISRGRPSAFVGWRGELHARGPASRVEPDASSFAARLGVPERGELLELLLEQVGPDPSERLRAFCLAFGLPTAAVGITAEDVAEERRHLPTVERYRHVGRLARLRTRLSWRRRRLVATLPSPRTPAR
jgi:hypothetical protein